MWVFFLFTLAPEQLYTVLTAEQSIKENTQNSWRTCQINRNSQRVFVVNCLQVFVAKILNHMVPSLGLGSIESKWISRDKKQVRGRCWSARDWDCATHCMCVHKMWGILGQSQDEDHPWENRFLKWCTAPVDCTMFNYKQGLFTLSHTQTACIMLQIKQRKADNTHAVTSVDL